ncbi:MAG TPA: hypothetical protein VD767_11515 [Thermomicrobiales bacterium]|nr:hypothetical protein [Thermomicrobiales bacterium]
MILRILYLVALLGVIGGDARDDSDAKMGGEGFGNVVMLAVLVGILLLGAIVVIALLALNGQFENTNVDPAV